MADPTPTRLDTVDPSISLDTAATRFRERLLALCPASRAQSLALTKLDECLMWAKNGIERIAAPVAALLVLLLPALALAQAVAADAPIGSGWDTMLTIWQGAGATVLAGLGWLAAKGYALLAAYLRSKTQNELALQALAAGDRLRGYVHTGVLAANQVVGDKIREAKSEASPGGTAITGAEAQQIKEACWDAIKAQVGGWDGLVRLFGALVGNSEGALKVKVDTMIEAEVQRTKLAGAPGPQ